MSKTNTKTVKPKKVTSKQENVKATDEKVLKVDKAAKGTEVKAAVKEVKTTEDKKAMKAEKTTAAKKPAEAKKTEVKPAVKKAAVIEKSAVKEADAKAVKTAEKKGEEVKPASKKVIKASETVKAAVKSEKAAVAKSEVKKTEGKKAEAQKPKTVKTKATEDKKPIKSKKPVAKKVNQEKLNQYAVKALADCINDMKKMNVQYDYEDYCRLLLDEADLKKLASNIIEGNHIKEGNYDFNELGYDIDLVAVTLNKVAETMDIKASDFKDYKKAMTKALRFTLGEDAEANAAEYLDEFKLAEKLLMIAQRKDIIEGAKLSERIGADVNEYFKHFFELAYALLPNWQYNDVKFYENFAYAVLSQFNDLYQGEQLRIQIDVADLYIKHGDYQLGDEMYGYILRDNQIKDYIYYRYASVYKDIDFNKAKSIAYSSFQYVDDRFTYYPNIMEIINQ